MLIKTSRLREERDFFLIYKKGQRISGNTLRISFLRTNQNMTRFGFVVAKKDLLLATARNRVKRILRAEVRRLGERIKKGYDVIIQGQRASKTATPVEIRLELVKLLERGKVIT